MTEEEAKEMIDAFDLIAAKCVEALDPDMERVELIGIIREIYDTAAEYGEDVEPLEEEEDEEEEPAEGEEEEEEESA